MSVPFNDLNDAQKRAVKTIDNRVLILAGPGTGKTEVLGHRIRYLIQEKNAQPSEILAITFTVKAAQEMFNRLKEFTNFDPSGIRILTIHGESWRIVSQNLPDKTVIADDDEVMMVLKDTIEDLGIQKSSKQLKKIRKAIELIKANNKLPIDLFHFQDEFFEIFQKYEHLLLFNRATDFGGILTTTNRLLRDPAILKKCQSETEYLLVDEYQDINQAQFEFIRTLSHKALKLFCVGDDDQSIYDWRGARADFILNFRQDFSGAEELFLQETRRCPENILKAAVNLISNTPQHKRRPKSIYAYHQDGDPVYILKSSSEKREALWIAAWIEKRLSHNTFSPQDIAIICRDIELAKYVVHELRERSIPVEYWREGALFKDSDVKDILAHLKIVVNPQNNLALRRCLLSHSVRNVGGKRVALLRKNAQARNRAIWDILSSVYDQPRPQKWQLNIFEFMNWIQDLRKIAKNESVGVVVDRVIEKLNPPKKNKYIEKLKNLANTSDMSVKGFLNEIITKRRLDLTGGGAEPEGEEKAVAVMSMHSSKGLTYKVVFIVGLEEGIFPKDMSNIEEERKLCYVAMTRAKKKLFLCTAKRRKGRAAQGLAFYDHSSIFLTEIYPCIVQQINNYS